MLTRYGGRMLLLSDVLTITFISSFSRRVSSYSLAPVILPLHSITAAVFINIIVLQESFSDNT